MLAIEKLYVDLVTDDGTVAIGYALKVRAAGVSFAPCGLELYTPLGERVVLRADRAQVTLGRGSLELVLERRDGPIRIVHEASLAEWCPRQDGAVPGIDWSVALTLGKGKLTLPDGRTLVGCGYADRVNLRGWPRRLGLARLEWGRVHFERGAVVFTQVELSDGRSWKPAVAWAIGDRPEILEDWRLDEEGDAFRFEAKSDRIELRPRVELHAGDAIDAARFPRRLELLASRLLMGASRERRWLSHARSDRFGLGLAVHETVRFGAGTVERA